MKKFFLLLLAVFMSACSVEITMDDPVNEDVVYGDEIDFRLDHVQLIDPGQYSEDVTLQFDLYLEREDLGIKEPNNDYSLYTSDLPEGIQPKIMTVEENGSMCHRPVFPHRCEAQISEKDLDEKNLEYEIVIEFEDGYMAKKTVSIPIPKMIDEPEVVFPVNAPAQGTDVKVKFKDVEADSYIVDVLLCHPYGNDGINPCLDGVQYSLIKEDNELIYEYGDDFYMPKIDVSNGLVEVSSSMSVSYEESVQYIVVAGVRGEFEDGTTYYVESLGVKSFEAGSDDTK